MRCFQVTIVVVENQSIVQDSDRMFASFDMQHAKRMLRVIFSFVACLTLQYHLHYLKEGNVSKTIDQITRFFISVQSVLETLLY